MTGGAGGGKADRRAAAIFAAFFAAWTLLRLPWLLSPLPGPESNSDLLNPAFGDPRSFPFLFNGGYYAVFFAHDYHPLSTLLDWLGRAAFGFHPVPGRLLRWLLSWGVSALTGVASASFLGPWSWAAAGLHAFFFADAGLAQTRFIVRDELTALFCLMAVWVWSSRRGPARSWPAGGLYLLALASKATGVVLPLLCALADRAEGRRPQGPSAARRRALEYAPMAAALAFYALWLSAAIGTGARGGGSIFGYSRALRAAIWIRRDAAYAAHLLAGAQNTSAPWAAALGACWLALAFRRRRPFMFLSLAWCVLAFLPVSGLIPVSTLSEHLAQEAVGELKVKYLVLPAVGLCWLFAGSLRDAARVKDKLALGVSAAWLALVVRAAWPLSLGTPTGQFVRVAQAESRAALAPSMVLVEALLAQPFARRSEPAALVALRDAALRALGPEGGAVSDWAESVLDSPCRAAIAVDLLPGSWPPLSELPSRVKATQALAAGCEAAREGRPGAAIDAFRRAQAWAPEPGAAHAELAASYLRAGDLRGALVELRWAKRAPEVSWRMRTYCGCSEAPSELEPRLKESADLADQAADAFVQGDASRALASARRAVQTDPGSARAAFRAAVLEEYGGDAPAARRDYEAAHRLAAEEPPDALSETERLWLARRAGVPSPVRRRPQAARRERDDGIHLFLAGRKEAARDLLRSAVRDDPRDAEAWLSLGAAEAGSGRRKRAAGRYAEALRVRREWRAFASVLGGKPPEPDEVLSAIASSAAGS